MKGLGLELPRTTIGVSRWRRFRAAVDWPLIATMLALCAIGLVNLYSATRGRSDLGLNAQVVARHQAKFDTQLEWMVVGVIAFMIATIVDYRSLVRVAWIGLGIATLLLLVARVVGHHVDTNGHGFTYRWLNIGGFGIQPSELVKLTFVLVLARLYSTSEPTHYAGWIWSPRSFAFRLALLALPIVLVAVQPDLGTAVLLALIVLTVGFLAMPSVWPMVYLTAGMLATIPFLWEKLQDYQRNRILGFIDCSQMPSKSLSDLCLQTQQSVYAVGSGRDLGQGLPRGHAEPAQLRARALDRFPVLGVGRGVGVHRFGVPARDLRLPLAVDGQRRAQRARSRRLGDLHRRRRDDVLARRRQHRDGARHRAGGRRDAAVHLVRRQLARHLLPGDGPGRERLAAQARLLMVRLITIPFSHYCEKARWALDRAGVDYVEDGHLPMFHWLPALRAGGRRTVPVAVDRSRVIADSSDIVIWAEQQQAGVLLPDGAARDEALALEDAFDRELGPATRRWAYFYLLPRRELLGKLADDVPRWEMIALRALRPAAVAFMRRGLRISPASVARSRDKIDAMLERVAAVLADGRRYLVADRFTVADLTFASLMTPVLLPAEHPFWLPTPDQLPAEASTQIATWRAAPAGQFALRLYREDRAV